MLSLCRALKARDNAFYEFIESKEMMQPLSNPPTCHLFGRAQAVSLKQRICAGTRDCPDVGYRIDCVCADCDCTHFVGFQKRRPRGGGSGSLGNLPPNTAATSPSPSSPPNKKTGR